MRIAIIGGPRTGKTTLALQLGARLAAQRGGCTVWHTDDFIPLGWSEASDEVARILTLYADDEDIVFEGVSLVRALRKALVLRPEEAPVDRCIVLGIPYVRLTSRQRAMASGCATVLAEIEPELVRRGVQIERSS